MQRIPIDLGPRSYAVVIEDGLIRKAGQLLRESVHARSAALVSGGKAGSLYAGTVAESLAESGFKVSQFTMPEGEENKNLGTVSSLYTEMLGSGLDRSSVLVALGGGVVGDTAGFAAATLFRGIPFLQIPTTLLSQVDSSVGGKVGVNHPLGKNLIGAIYQPAAVIVDPDVLSTLSERERASGFAEIVKYGLIRDPDLYSLCMSEYSRILSLEDRFSLQHVIKRSVEIKAEVVGRDEFEGGLRMILNFGHTVGHAVENTAGYGVFTHGEAVVMGMAAAVHISAEMKLLDRETAADVISGLMRLPVKKVAQFPGRESLHEAMYHDKKVREGRIRFVLLEGIGRTVIRDDVPVSLVHEGLELAKEMALD